MADIRNIMSGILLDTCNSMTNLLSPIMAELCPKAEISHYNKGDNVQLYIFLTMQKILLHLYAINPVNLWIDQELNSITTSHISLVCVRQTMNLRLSSKI